MNKNAKPDEPDAEAQAQLDALTSARIRAEAVVDREVRVLADLLLDLARSTSEITARLLSDINFNSNPERLIAAADRASEAVFALPTSDAMECLEGAVTDVRNAFWELTRCRLAEMQADQSIPF
jgi:hypothetical protein